MLVTIKTDLRAFVPSWRACDSDSLVGGGSTVPAGVHGPQRKTRLTASQPPRITPKRVMHASP